MTLGLELIALAACGGILVEGTWYLIARARWNKIKARIMDAGGISRK